MITYTTAKRLKEAGFPQNTMYASVLPPENKGGKRIMQIMKREEYCNSYINLLSAGYDVVSMPFLEELIEACGEKFFSLTKHVESWQTNWIDGMAGETAGSTPPEAVANLWLSLNEK